MHENNQLHAHSALSRIRNYLGSHSLRYFAGAIAVVAIVGYPDRRLGERVCAFVSLKPGARFDFQEMVGYLEGRQVAKQYWPERLEIVEDLPRTPSGKLQKFKLRAPYWADRDRQVN